MSTGLWERERAAYLLDRSRAGTSARRRAEVLARDARRLQRSSVGVGQTLAQDEITPAWHRRVTADAGPWTKGAVYIGLGVAAVAGGVGAAVGAKLVYPELTRRAGPRMGRKMIWVGAGAAGVAAAAWIARAALTDWPWLGIAFGVGRYFPGDWVTVGGVLGWLVFQLIVMLATVALMIWNWGWVGVPANAVKAPEKNADGSYYAPPESKLARLDPLAGVEVTRQERAAPEPGERVIPWGDSDAAAADDAGDGSGGIPLPPSVRRRIEADDEKGDGSNGVPLRPGEAPAEATSKKKVVRRVKKVDGPDGDGGGAA